MVQEKLISLSLAKVELLKLLEGLLVSKIVVSKIPVKKQFGRPHCTYSQLQLARALKTVLFMPIHS